MLKEYRTLFPYIKRYRWFYVAGVLCLLVTSGGQLLIPQFIKVAVDTIVKGDFDLSSVGITMLKLVGVAAVIAVARFGWRYFLHGSSRRIEKELRGRLFTHLLTLSPTFFDRNRTGDIMARATNDMHAIRMATGMALVAFIDGAFLTLAILIILFSQHARLALFTILPLPLIAILVISLGNYIGRLFKKVQEGFSVLSEQSREAISGIRVIKTFVKEQYFLHRFGEANENYKERNMAYIRIYGLFMPIVMFLSGLTTLLLLRFGGELVLLQTISPGDFVATLNYLQMLVWPMLGAGFTVTMLARGAASLERINQILSETPDIRSPERPMTTVPNTSIAIRNLTFSYPGSETEVLKQISVEIPEGTFVGMLGKTGSGKSTLIKMIPRLLDPPAGTVYIGGCDIRDYSLETLRKQFGMVPQDTFLFSATIQENMAFALPEQHDTDSSTFSSTSEARLQQVADISTISREISEFPSGWQTRVGERGVTLSGGQKQRIAISRALAIDPPVLLFDDALSSVDTESEKRILKELLEYRRGRTNIIISHRVSTLMQADLILVLEDGQIVQKGTHEQLVAEEGFYKEVYTLQKLEEQTIEEKHNE